MGDDVATQLPPSGTYAFRALPHRRRLASAAAAAAAAPPVPQVVEVLPPPPSSQRKAKAAATEAFLSKLMPPRYAARVDEYVTDAIRSGFSPTMARVASFIFVESGGEVSSAQTRRYLRARFAEYNRTRNVSGRNKRGSMRTLFGHALGNYAVDLAFFTKSVAGFSRWQNACLVVTCCGGTRLLLLETVYRNRSAESILEALEACRQRLIRTYGRREGIRRLYADQESGLKSRAAEAWLKENGIQIVFYTSSAKKSYLAERAIRTVRVELERQRIVRGDAFNPYDLLPQIEKAHNARKLSLGSDGRPSAWSPAEVTTDTYQRYIAALFRLKPVAYFSLYSLGDGYVDYKFELDALVYLKHAFVSSKALEKRSVITVETEPLYSVAARYTVVASSFTALVPYYRILPVHVYKGKITAKKIRAALNARGLFVPEFALVSK